MRREVANLDLSWIRDKTLEDSADLEDPDVIAEEIADDLEAALEQFATIATSRTGAGRHGRVGLLSLSPPGRFATSV